MKLFKLFNFHFKNFLLSLTVPAIFALKEKNFFPRSILSLKSPLGTYKKICVAYFCFKNNILKANSWSNSWSFFLWEVNCNTVNDWKKLFISHILQLAKNLIVFFIVSWLIFILSKTCKQIILCRNRSLEQNVDA